MNASGSENDRDRAAQAEAEVAWLRARLAKIEAERAGGTCAKCGALFNLAEGAGDSLAGRSVYYFVYPGAETT